MIYNKFTIKNIVEIIIFGVITLLLNLIDIKMPALLFISLILSTISIVIITVKYKEIKSIITCLSILLILLIKIPVTEALVKFFVFSFAGITIGYLIRNEYNLKETIIGGTVAFVTAFLLTHVIVNYFHEINIINNLYTDNVSNFFESIGMKNNNLNDLNIIPNQIDVRNFTLELYNKLLQFPQWWQIIFIFEFLIFATFIGGSNLNVLFVIIPGAITLAGLIISFIIIKISMAILKNKAENNNIELFSEFKLPAGFGMTFILVMLFLWGSNFQNSTFSIVESVLLNMVIILGFGFIVQGLALVDYYLKVEGLNGIIRLLLYSLLSIFLLVFSSLVLITGILDYVFNFRKLETR